jgi:hypothetical protein
MYAPFHLKGEAMKVVVPDANGVFTFRPEDAGREVVFVSGETTRYHITLPSPKEQVEEHGPERN